MITRIVKYLFIIALAIFHFGNVAAQNPIKKSTEIVVIGGKKCYLHIVREGETLYGISKAYDIPQKEIALENPDVFDGLKVGQTLKVPVKVVETVIPDKDDNFTYHKIKKSQTLYSISKEYDVPIDEIVSYNPSAKDGLKVGEYLKIPKKGTENSNSTNADNEPEKDKDKYIYHKVKKKETLYSLSKKYNTTIRQILAENPELKDRPLNDGETIRILKTETNKVENTDFEKDSTLAEVVKQPKDSLFTIDTMLFPCDSFDLKTYGKPFNIALMLPFNLDEIDIIKEEDHVDNKKMLPKAKPFLEFYEGFLIAVDSLKEVGISVNLFAYNTLKDSATVSEIMHKEEMKHMDMIIGPAFSSNLKIVADIAEKMSIPVISPFYSKVDQIEDNPFLYQVNPAFLTQMHEMMHCLVRHCNKNFVVIHQGDSTENEFLGIFKEMLISEMEASFPDSALMYKEVNTAKEKTSSIDKYLSSDIDNIVMIPSNDQAYISDIITKLNSLAEKKHIVLVGLPSWRKFDNIELEYIHALRMHTFTPFTTDYDSPEVVKFIAKYRDMFKSEPAIFNFCHYSLYGYDIGMYFIQSLASGGKNFGNCLENKVMLQSGFDFHKGKNFDGYENNRTFVLRYDKDFTIKVIDPQNFKPEDFVIEYDSDNKRHR